MTTITAALVHTGANVSAVSSTGIPAMCAGGTIMRAY
jgi:hypothetical protein